MDQPLHSKKRKRKKKRKEISNLHSFLSFFLIFLQQTKTKLLKLEQYKNLERFAIESCKPKTKPQNYIPIKLLIAPFKP